MKVSSSGLGLHPEEGDKKCLNSELWHACAGPLVSLPSVGSRVVYFPQGHSEQVAASTNKEVDPQIPNYPNLPPQLICQLHDVAMHVDAETDEVYAQMTLQPLSHEEQKEAFFPADLGALSKQPTNYFCKTLTASDTSTHGGFSVPRRSAEKVFPPLDFSQQPPAQELIARDLRDNEWKFRHIFRGQPKRHLLTTGWSVFVSAKKLVAGDSVLFIWNDNNQLLLGIRRANRPQTVMPSSVLSSDSMHIGLLAAAAHAAATNSHFTVFYNPRASPTVFVIPLAKYVKAVYHTRVSIGMRFRMLFETEESSVRRYMGTITGVSDLDPGRWPNSHWRSVKVGWDESTSGEKQTRVSLWDIEPLTTFPMYPLPFSLRLKRPWLPDMAVPSMNFQIPGSSSSMQSRLDASLLNMQPEIYQAIAAVALQGHSKQASSSILQFQQPQVVPNGAGSLLPSQSLQHMLQPQQSSLEITQGSQGRTKMQSHLFKPETQNHNVFNEQQQLAWQQQQWLSTLLQLQQQVAHQHQSQNQQAEEHHVLKQMFEQQYQQPHHPPSNQRKSLELLQKYLNQNQVEHVVPTLQFDSPRLPPIFHMQNNFSESGNNPLESANQKPLNGILGSVSSEMPTEIVSSSTWLPERIGVDDVIPYGSLCNSPKMEKVGQSRARVSQPSIMSSPFLQSECLATQEVDFSEHSNILLGVQANSSSLLNQNGVANSRNFIGRTDSTAFPFIASSFTDNVDSGFPFSSPIAINCLDESVFSRSTDNGGQVEPPAETFVKVYKSGSFGRSLDISKFNSYPELRSELGRMFGLEGQLEDPLRSGWQLVFVDQENDVLLVGDDPWQEFVNSVGHIKILSPQEVQQMGNPSDELLSDLPTKHLSSSGCDEYLFRQDSRNLSSGIMSVGSLDY